MSSNRHMRKSPDPIALPRCEAWALPLQGRASTQCRYRAPFTRDGHHVCMGDFNAPRVAFDAEDAA